MSDFLYRAVFAVRPALLAVWLKKILRIKRRVVDTSAGIKLFIDPVSHFGREVLKTGEYEPYLTQLMKNLLRPGDVFVDVGANEGYFSVLGSRLVQNGRVIAIEPQSRLIPVIQQNLESNGCHNVELLQAALGEAEGNLVLNLAPDTNTGGSSHFSRFRFFSQTESVPVHRLDATIQGSSVDRVRLIKIDCEGAETQVLRGAEALLARTAFDFLSVDYHPHIVGPKIVTELDRYLRQSGYLLTQAGNGVWVYHLPGLERALAPLGELKKIAPLAA